MLDSDPAYLSPRQYSLFIDWVCYHKYKSCFTKSCMCAAEDIKLPLSLVQMKSSTRTIYLVLILVVTLAALLNVTFLDRMYALKDSKHNISTTYPLRAESTVGTSCPSDYSMNASYTAKYAGIKQLSLYNSSKQEDDFNQTIVILTPISNVGEHLANYFRLLCSLDYPHHLISVVLGEDTSSDRSLEVAKLYAQKLQSRFRRVDVHRLGEDLKGKPLRTRHDKEWQLKRRAHLAASRNRVLSLGLRDEDWVLWLDADVEYVPVDIIQHLMSCKADVCVASCLFKTTNGWRSYDMNSWQETNASLAFLREQQPDYLMLEGYSATKRRILPSIQDQGLVVDLDGVGGTALLVKADAHRKGLIFPTFVFENHIETEGMAKLAKKMRMSLKGLPFVSVIHR